MWIWHNIELRYQEPDRDKYTIQEDNIQIQYLYRSRIILQVV